MRSLLESIENLKKTEVREIIEKRMKEFEDLGKQPDEAIFSELCFCLLTANFSAERSMRMQEEIGNGFSKLLQPEMAAKLKELGHRFPNARSRYMTEARKHRDNLKEILGGKSGKEARGWLVKNVKGLGYKEASHFLRNVGYRNLAIIDFHIVDLLVKNKIIRKPKYLTKKKYLYIEEKLRKIADKTDLNLWYLETGKVLK